MKTLILLEQGVSSRHWEDSVPILKNLMGEVFFATVRERGVIHDTLESKGIPTISLNAKTSKNYPIVIMRLAKIMHKEKFDIIHSNESLPTFIAGSSRLLAPFGKHIFHRQHIEVEAKQAFFSRVGSKLCHVVMAVSKAAAEAAQQIDGVNANKVKVAYSGVGDLRNVPQKEIQEIRSKLNIEENAAVISMVARLRLEKGYKTLFEALPIIEEKLNKPLHLILAGNGSEEAIIKEMAKSTILRTKIHFVGYQEDVALWHSVGDVVAMPSYREAFGLSAVESMLCKRTLIASKVGGLNEIIEDGINGFLIEPNDPQALAESLTKCLNSPETTRIIGLNAREIAIKKFSPETMVRSWLDCYHFALTTKEI